MFNYSVPSWVDRLRFTYKSVDEVPEVVFADLNKRLGQVVSKTPEVSIVIAAYNEEVNIIQCINSLSLMKTHIPFEIIVVNNNSSDNTKSSLNKLAVKSYFQAVQGCGPARQLGQEQAGGTYILLADADCIYPEGWLTQMMKVLRQPGVVCVYGRYSFIPGFGFARYQLFLLEKMKDVIAEIRHFKRPYLNAYGISMGYLREYGIKVGYVMHNVRGDDGRLAFDLMSYGKIRQVKSNLARPWTGPRTLAQDGSMFKAITSRVFREIKRVTSLISSEKPHDTKSSTNK